MNLSGKVWWKTRLIWERVQGLDFSAIVSSETAGLDPSLSFRSSPSGGGLLANVLRELPITGNSSILDVGCGKGSAMRTMLSFQFREVAGLELSPQLANIAAKNFERLHAARAKVVCGDAVAFDDYSTFDFLYFYNPFPAQVMKIVTHKIVAAAAQRQIHVIYNNPTCDACFRAYEIFQPIRDFPGEHSNIIRVYRTTRP